MGNDCSKGCDQAAMYCARCYHERGRHIAEVERDRDEWRNTCTSLKSHRDKLVEAMEEIHAWEVCAPISTPEDMMQNISRIIELSAKENG